MNSSPDPALDVLPKSAIATYLRVNVPEDERPWRFRWFGIAPSAIYVPSQGVILATSDAWLRDTPVKREWKRAAGVP